MVKKEVRDFSRFNHIMLILAQEGMGHIADKIKAGKLFKRGVEVKPERLVATLERLGPTFVKLGQILSLRPDLIPKEYVKALGNLQDEVPAFPYIDVERIIKEELGKSISKVFKKFSKKPIAAASISQVHKATLKDGTAVAVKVQRPTVATVMASDIEIMFHVADILEKRFEKFRRYKPKQIVEEFKQWTERELDFRVEAKNAKIFHQNSKDMEIVKIPWVYDEYSGKRVLTTEFIEGVELHNVGKKKGYDTTVVIQNGFDTILKQVFVDGVFHGDPHPGNILVLGGNKIGLVDFGIVGQFDEHLKKQSIELFYGVVEEDMNAIVDAFLNLGLVDEQTNIDHFKKDIEKVVKPLQKSRLRDVKVSYVLEEVLDIALKHHIRMPIDFVLFGKTIVELEGIALQYAPDFKFVDKARPFIERLIKSEISVSGMAKSFTKNLFKYGRLFADIPDKLDSALTKVEKGAIRVDIEDTDIKLLGQNLDASTRRLTYGMVIAAFIVSGALLAESGPMTPYGFSYPALLCFVLALTFSIFLVRIKR